jgi:hypothetical protein
VRRRSVLLNIVNIFSLFVIHLSASPRSLAAEQSSGVPAWLMAHVGEGEGQIARPVLQRARALYLQKSSEGAVRNSCYFAMDATRPNALAAGGRYERIGLLWALQGEAVVALTAETACLSGSQTYRRRI